VRLHLVSSAKPPNQCRGKYLGIFLRDSVSWCLGIPGTSASAELFTVQTGRFAPPTTIRFLDHECNSCLQVLETERQCLEHDRAELLLQKARSMLSEWVVPPRPAARVERPQDGCHAGDLRGRRNRRPSVDSSPWSGQFVVTGRSLYILAAVP